MSKHKTFSSVLTEDIQMLKKTFQKSVDVSFREFTFTDQSSYQACCIYIDGLADTQMIDKTIQTLKELSTGVLKDTSPSSLTEKIKLNILTNPSVKETEDIQKGIDAVLSGDSLWMIDSSQKALIISTRGGEARSITEPQTEQVVRGPRDGFTENIRTNTSLIRRRIRDPMLHIEELTIGEKSKTSVNILYLDGTAKENLVDEVKKRLNAIKIDAILDSGYIEELIKDAPYSPFSTLIYTERPDKVASSIYEGRVVVLVDNSPFALIMPANFWQFLQASDDYYFSFIAGSFFRVIRYIGALLSFVLPSIYVMLVSFHQEMIPTSLALTIASGREVTPFPVLLEALLMEIVFELMREAGLRMPKPVGQAVSIVGSLVIGQAAVQAGLVSPFMVIVIALTGIASFAIPNAAASFSIRFIRFPLLIASGTLGLLGFAAMLTFFIIHLLSLRSFGESYLAPATPFQPSDQKDLIIRAPWWKMVKNAAVAEGTEDRMGKDLIPEPPTEKEKLAADENTGESTVKKQQKSKRKIRKISFGEKDEK